MKISLCTIPHTGTWFFSDLFTQHGFTVEAFHCTDSGLQLAEEAYNNGHQIITAYRGVDLIKASWLYRKREDDLSKYMENWYKLSCRYDPIVVTCDPRVNRYEVLAKAGEKLGVEFITDWKIVNPDGDE